MFKPNWHDILGGGECPDTSGELWNRMDEHECLQLVHGLKYRKDVVYGRTRRNRDVPENQRGQIPDGEEQFPVGVTTSQLRSAQVRRNLEGWREVNRSARGAR